MAADFCSEFLRVLLNTSAAPNAKCSHRWSFYTHKSPLGAAIQDTITLSVSILHVLLLQNQSLDTSECVISKTEFTQAVHFMWVYLCDFFLHGHPKPSPVSHCLEPNKFLFLPLRYQRKYLVPEFCTQHTVRFCRFWRYFSVLSPAGSQDQRSRDRNGERSLVLVPNSDSLLNKLPWNSIFPSAESPLMLLQPPRP